MKIQETCLQKKMVALKNLASSKNLAPTCSSENSPPHPPTLIVRPLPQILKPSPQRHIFFSPSPLCQGVGCILWKLSDNKQNLFFYYKGYWWHLNLLGFNISFYKFHLVWSAEISKWQIVTFPFLAYYIRDFLKKTWRGHHSIMTHFSNFQVPKTWGKNYAK